MSDDKLIASKAKDGFTTESPIRAFTEFRVSGTIAIGKGFRPSLGHLHTYLDAMEAKEGWRFVQILLPDNDAGDPTILFHKEGAPPSEATTLSAGPLPADVLRDYRDGPNYKGGGRLAAAADLGAPHDTHLHIRLRSPMGGTHVSSGIYTKGRWFVITRIMGDEMDLDPLMYAPESWMHLPGGGKYVSTPFGPDSILAAPPLVFKDDPINPKHYDGTQCAEIGELLTPDTYQTLKYCWRLGEKDDPCVELGKGLWYLKREIALMQDRKVTKRISYDPRVEWVEERIAHRSTFTQSVARGFWQGYHGVGMTAEMLRVIYCKIEEKRNHYDCGSGLAI